MRIQVMTAGTYGDVRPYVALTRGLCERGHDARLLGPNHYAPVAEQAGVPFEGLGPYGDEGEVRRVIVAMTAEHNQNRHPLIGLRVAHHSLMQLAANAIDRTREADLIVAHNVGLFGFIAAEANRKPLATGHLFPCLIPSSRTWVTGRNYGTWFNRLLWRFARRVVGRWTDPLCNEALAAFGLPPQKGFMLGASHSRICNLVAVSPRILPRDPLWPLHYECTGYWTMPEPGYRPDPKLEAFVEESEPPVVITFGSMVEPDAAAFTRLLVEAVDRCPRRVVIQAGWSGLGQGELPEHVRIAPFVPHDWLFSRAACVVHHGGAGTAAAAILAGKPQVVVYHMCDQQFWARHLQRLGLSAGAIWSHRFRADWLSRSIGRALGDERMIDHASAVGRAVAAEDGIARAVSTLERVAEGIRRPRRMLPVSAPQAIPVASSGQPLPGSPD